MNDALLFVLIGIPSLLMGIILGHCFSYNEPIVTYTHNIDNYRYVVMCENKNIENNPKCSYFINGKQVPDPFKNDVK